MEWKQWLRKPINFFTWFAVYYVVIEIVARLLLLTTGYEYDEVFSAVTANPALSWTYIVKHYLLVDCHPPLYNFLLWVYNHFVPYGPEWIARLPSVVLGWAGLWIAWKFFPRFFGKTARWIFVLLVSSNLYFTVYSQHARAYALLLFLSIAFTFLYLKMARWVMHRRPIPSRCWVLYGSLSLLLCYSHYFGALAFGIFSSILFVLACIYKQKKRWFIIVPLIVFILFLPWLVPNLLQNLSLERFQGNWWANASSSKRNVWEDLATFIFSSYRDYSLMMLVTIISFIYMLKHYHHKHQLPYMREYGLLVSPFLLALCFSFLMSIKIFLLISRYFIPFMPGLYLFLAVIIGTVARRHRYLLIGFAAFLISSFYTFCIYVPVLHEGHFFSSRAAAEVYKKMGGADKELFVLAFEGFPKEAMVPMFSYYPHVRFGLTQPVTELIQLSEQEREEVLKRKENAIIMLPNCSLDRLVRLYPLLHREPIVQKIIVGHCFLELSDLNISPEEMAGEESASLVEMGPSEE